MFDVFCAAEDAQNIPKSRTVQRGPNRRWGLAAGEAAALLNELTFDEVSWRDFHHEDVCWGPVRSWFPRGKFPTSFKKHGRNREEKPKMGSLSGDQGNRRAVTYVL